MLTDLSEFFAATWNTTLINGSLYTTTKWCFREEESNCFEHGQVLTDRKESAIWVEAVNTSVYLQNGLYTKTLEDKTPYEVWTNFKPKVSHLKIFGSVSSTHVPEARRTKLNCRSKVGILVGYNTLTKGYRVYNLFTHKVVVS